MPRRSCSLISSLDLCSPGATFFVMGNNNNMPALGRILDAIKLGDKQRWRRHVAEFGITADEQTSHQVRAALSRKDVDGALYAVYRARKELAQMGPSGPAQAPVSLGGEIDEGVAAALAVLSARHAE